MLCQNRETTTLFLHIARFWAFKFHFTSYYRFPSFCLTLFRVQFIIAILRPFLDPTWRCALFWEDISCTIVWYFQKLFNLLFKNAKPSCIVMCSVRGNRNVKWALLAPALVPMKFHILISTVLQEHIFNACLWNSLSSAMLYTTFCFCSVSNSSSELVNCWPLLEFCKGWRVFGKLEVQHFQFWTFGRVWMSFQVIQLRTIGLLNFLLTTSEKSRCMIWL